MEWQRGGAGNGFVPPIPPEDKSERGADLADSIAVCFIYLFD
jgi:hypothetical protein